MTLIFKLFSYNTSSCFFLLCIYFLETLLYTDNDVTVFINTIVNGIFFIIFFI